MSETAPTIPNQEHLFDPNEANTIAEQQQPETAEPSISEEEKAERTAAAESIFAKLDRSDTDQYLEKPLKDKDYQATVDAISILRGDQAELPEGMRIARDWSDNQKEYREKQADDSDEAVTLLEARIKSHDLKQAIKDRDDRKVMMEKSIAKDAAERASIKAKHIEAKKLEIGSITYNNPLFKEDLEIEANRAVSDHFASKIGTLNVEAGKGTAIDMDVFKSETEQRKQKAVASQNATSNALKDFQKGFKPENNQDNSDDADTQKMKTLEEQHLEVLEVDFATARDEYARLTAGRGRRAFFKNGKGGEFSASNLTAAKEKFEKAFEDLQAQEVSIAHESGISNDELKKLASSAAAQSEWSLTTSVYQQRMVATGRGKINEQGVFQQVEPKTFFGKAANKFYDWWGNQYGVKGTAAKVVTGAAVGIGIGAAVSLTGGTILLGPIAGGAVGSAVASRLSKTWLMSKISNKASGLKQADNLHDELQQGIMYPNNIKTSDTVERQTKDEVRNSRKRAVVAVGTLALGALGGDLLGHAIGLDHSTSTASSHHVGGHNHSTEAAKQSHPSQPSKPSRPSSAGHPSKPNGTGSQHPKASGYEVNASRVNSEYVSTVYEHAEGLHSGLSNMNHAVALAQRAHEINIIYPNPADHNEFFYRTADGHEDTESVLKVLAKYGGKVKVRSQI